MDWSEQQTLFRAEMRAAFSVPSANAHVLVSNILDGYDREPRTPLWTRHMLGVIEAERDRRRHRYTG